MTAHFPLSPPKYPSYLKLTHYASLASEQYYQKRHLDLDLRLPQYWNKTDKSQLMEVGIHGFDLNYALGKTNYQHTGEAASIRTNFPMRPQCGVYYFEVRICSNGLDGLFAIGICTRQAKLDRLPGQDVDSFGYFGQDGQVYLEKQSKHGGPSFSSGDIVGCGVNFANSTLFFTKNGISLGCEYEFHQDRLYYPCIGLSTPGEKVAANFGQEPFLFDIQQIAKRDTSTLLQDKLRKDVNHMLVSYLIHLGYLQTATSLLKKTKHTACLTEDDMHYSHIRKAIMSGCVDEATRQVHTLCPNLLETDLDLSFELKTRKFLDILMDTSPCHSLSSSLCLSEDTDDDTLSTYSGRSRTLSISSSSDLYHHHHHYHHSTTEEVSTPSVSSPPLHVAASGRRLSWAAVAASPTLPSCESETHETRKRLFSRRSSSSHGYITDLEEQDEEDVDHMSTVRQAMLYGQSLQEEYQHQPKYLNKLIELFSLLSYPDPKTSSEAHLLDMSLRDTTATTLIKAMKGYKQQSNISSLELAYKQTMVVTKELVLLGHGQTSLIDLHNY
ncbi:concanavalin A-like lectin/glucanase domain-containing protein [Gilbertella persicaria]|uniref:concanavalin A-like lectin/glucanase domain-containing protein n=1 Tax=Gilbertella persicaria TaxID=101096 RepID=UPI00221FF9DB|nr:concanavalin A-like lectin/glucanase domain-containing protein [Gilbertella persicaria]KAI8080167.1 concanavalin A-like lectin/glucanase domain-containing protein [Gilbertella persicaria]